MARKLKARNETNGFDPGRIRSFVAEIETEFTKLESEKGAYMARAKAIRERIDDVYTTAKAIGVPKPPLKAAVKARALERKLEAIPESFEDLDERDKYQMIRDALGDFASTPLGEAAAGPPENVASLADAAEENFKRLRRGIKQLDKGGDEPAPGAA